MLIGGMVIIGSSLLLKQFWLNLCTCILLKFSPCRSVQLPRMISLAPGLLPYICALFKEFSHNYNVTMNLTV